MSRIDDLIAEQCPEGVELRPLGDVGEFFRGSGLQKSDLKGSGMSAIHYGQLHTYYGIWAEHTKSFVEPSFGKKLRHARTGDLIIATTSEDDSAVAKATAWLGTGEVAVSGDAYIYRHTLDPRFVSYYFQSEQFQSQKQRYISGTKVRRISGDSLSKVRIPVPPLEVQREIVRILDGFTSLEAELEAELEARRAQYTHYRSSVFRDLDRRHCSLVSLADLGKWYGGGTPSKARPEYWNTGEIPWVSPKDMGRSVLSSTMDHITSTAVSSSATKLVPGGSVAIVARSSILNHTLPVAYVPMPVALNQDMKALVVREGILAKFVYYALEAHAEEILLKVRRMGGSVASLDSSRLRSFQIPIPQIEDQEQIVELLDKFDALVNDLTSGLPAELEARRRQYEYYRDELLTFKELV